MCTKNPGCVRLLYFTVCVIYVHALYMGERNKKLP